MALERLWKVVLECVCAGNVPEAKSAPQWNDPFHGIVIVEHSTHCACLFAFAHNLQQSNEWSFRIGARLTWINPTNSTYIVRSVVAWLLSCRGAQNTWSTQSHVTINQNSNLNRVFCLLLHLELCNLWKMLLCRLSANRRQRSLHTRAPPLTIIHNNNNSTCVK